MTVKELKQKLLNLPDDMLVFVADWNEATAPPCLLTNTTTLKTRIFTSSNGWTCLYFAQDKNTYVHEAEVLILQEDD